MELSPVFARRLYLALLVENLERPNVPKLIEKTGWPRRTIQDVLKALPGSALNSYSFKMADVIMTAIINFQIGGAF